MITLPAYRVIQFRLTKIWYLWWVSCGCCQEQQMHALGQNKTCRRPSQHLYPAHPRHISENRNDNGLQPKIRAGRAIGHRSLLGYSRGIARR